MKKEIKYIYLDWNIFNKLQKIEELTNTEK